MNQGKELIKAILLNGNAEEKRAVFEFNITDPDELILKKFKLFSRSSYPRFYDSPDSPEHDVTILNYIKSYKGFLNGIEIGFRGFGKTSVLKLFVAFVLLNDLTKHRKYIKILSKDGKNSKQIVTDVYNLIVEVANIYGSIFERQGDKKREETMSSFTTEDGRKLASGTVGQTQRGHIQDAYRPDWVWFEDLEDRDSVSSITITEGIIQKADEAITGLSLNGNYIVTANYISDVGVVQWFINKPNINVHIVPIITPERKPTWSRYTMEKIKALEGEAEDWAGEYLCDPTRVGDKFFDIDRVINDLANARKPDMVSAGVRYWAKDGKTFYLPHHRYGQGVDLSDGIGKDSCALAVFNFSTNELVATTDSNTTPPDLFTYEAIRVGQEFGNCIIAPEVNNTCGGIAITVLKDKQYPNIYIREVDTKVHNIISNEYGWKTTSSTKPQMFYEFKRDYDDGLIKIYDERVLKEMKSFSKSDLKERNTGSVTRHFDLLTATVIAWQMKTNAQIGDSVKKFYSNLSVERTPRGAMR